tara:strand:- start:4077 stop:4457 length:381 start_codon:yes stop_codon:yes gene_type:complete
MKPKSSNRSFGLLFFVVFIILGLWPLKNGNDINYYFIIISIIFLILSLIDSRLLSPLNKAWIKLGEILGLIIAPIIMAFVYFIFLTPISLIVRVFGKDLLGVKFNKKIDTYWLKRKKNLGSMRKQF